MDGWMDGGREGGMTRFYVPFNSVSVISGRWVVDNERLRAVKLRLPGLTTYFRFSFRFFKKGSCHLLAKVCARSTG